MVELCFVIVNTVQLMCVLLMDYNFSARVFRHIMTIHFSYTARKLKEFKHSALFFINFTCFGIKVLLCCFTISILHHHSENHNSHQSLLFESLVVCL